jgi:hypothetical protein
MKERNASRSYKHKYRPADFCERKHLSIAASALRFLRAFTIRLLGKRVPFFQIPRHLIGLSTEQKVMFLAGFSS